MGATGVNICTMFDSNYRAKGFALLASIRRHMPTAQVFLLALDDEVARRAEETELDPDNMVRLSAVEDAALRAARAGRTWQEYVWTLTPAWALYCMEDFGLGSIAYMDADCYLFDDLQPLYDEVVGADVAIISHRFTPAHQRRLEGFGTYNVSWTYFKNSPIGMKCLREWRDQCLSWCYLRQENGKCGDQGYLNDWPQKYRAHVVQHLGADLAPWNQEQYEYCTLDGKFVVDDDVRCDPLLFYHFHGWESQSHWTNFSLHPMVAKHVYMPYEAELARVA